jgi:hypothetical protein
MLIKKKEKMGKKKYKKIKLVCTSSSQITSLCNETTNGVSCERESGGMLGRGWKGEIYEVGKWRGDILKR